MTDAASGDRVQPTLLRRALSWVKTFAFGTLLSMHPLSSVVVLGWLTRRMGAIAETRLGRRTPVPGWVLGPPGEGRMAALIGGIGLNILTGAATFVALGLYTLPFTAVWLGAWWAGWENSFNKGYEQAFVGPAVFVAGMLIGAVLLTYLPYALAHLATERRWTAIFEARRLRSVVAHARWQVPGLALLTLGLALPVFALHGSPAFLGAMVPGIEDMGSEALRRVRGLLTVAAAGYTFAALFVLRALAAASYARAASRAAGADPQLWVRSRARTVATPERPPRLAVRMLWLLPAVAFSFGLCFLVLAAQFLNYSWWHWLSHPFYLLPYTH